MNPSSDVNRPADRAIWQFSLRQCLVAIAIVALVCAAFNYSLLIGWIASYALTVPIVIAVPTRQKAVFGLLIGALLGAVGAVPLIASTWSQYHALAMVQIVIGLTWSATVGAFLGVTVGSLNELWRRADHDKPLSK